MRAVVSPSSQSAQAEGPSSHSRLHASAHVHVMHVGDMLSLVQCGAVLSDGQPCSARLGRKLLGSPLPAAACRDALNKRCANHTELTCEVRRGSCAVACCIHQPPFLAPQMSEAVQPHVPAAPQLVTPLHPFGVAAMAAVTPSVGAHLQVASSARLGHPLTLHATAPHPLLLAGGPGSATTGVTGKASRWQQWSSNRAYRGEEQCCRPGAQARTAQQQQQRQPAGQAPYLALDAGRRCGSDCCSCCGVGILAGKQLLS